MAWLFLGLAISCEVIATSLLKSTEGFTRLWPTLTCLAGYAAAFYLLTLSLRQLQVGTAYAIWSGLGTVAIALVGAMFLNEPVTLLKGFGMALVIAGVVVLNLGGAH
ncbi:multidrug efflux SMR transporter [Embleya sp. NPDC005575]|uniref:DMT family transporter n=1 Tax=Embleya sp. NPDC005575 TaxID=3156892 RepID=UPI0033B9E48D